MITSRFYLALFGSIAVTALGLFSFLISVFVLGPFFLFFKVTKNDC